MYKVFTVVLLQLLFFSLETQSRETLGQSYEEHGRSNGIDCALSDLNVARTIQNIQEDAVSAYRKNLDSARKLRPRLFKRVDQEKARAGRVINAFKRNSNAFEAMKRFNQTPIDRVPEIKSETIQKVLAVYKEVQEEFESPEDFLEMMSLYETPSGQPTSRVSTKVFLDNGAVGTTTISVSIDLRSDGKLTQSFQYPEVHGDLPVTYASPNSLPWLAESTIYHSELTTYRNSRRDYLRCAGESLKHLRGKSLSESQHKRLHQGWGTPSESCSGKCSINFGKVAQ